MATSSKTPLVAEQMLHSSILNLQANQNLILDIDPSKYNKCFQPVIQCLRYYPLVIALIKSEIVPLVHISKAYSTTSYQKGDELITFEIFNQKTQITMSRFYNLLRLPQGHNLVDLESVSNSAILETFYPMG
ncbi:unnamed protein product [Lactuca saligna]|uniref:Uncharacterized protein n=1 Tax=Lactuca saligna TaxID=75948 RepID=A0AA35YZN2_LACSI|nr:unnamed protein product [Lactuca saligna]